MADEFRENYGSVFFTGILVCLVLAIIVYMIG